MILYLYLLSVSESRIDPEIQKVFNEHIDEFFA